MRRLEDGTYMYDTDSPWSYVIAAAIGAVVLFLGILYRVYQVIVIYKEFGNEGFRFLTDTGTSHIIWVGISVIWINVLVKYILRQIRSIRGSKAND